MERIALIIFLLWGLNSYGSENRLERELNFILGKETKAPVVPKVVTYESWKGDRPQSQMEDGMIVDSTSTALAAPVRDQEKIILNLKENKKKNSPFTGPRKRSR